MNHLLAVALASVVSMETLLFTFVDEQQFDTDCAQAVIESAVNTYWATEITVARDALTGDFSLSISEISEILDEIGLPNQAYWLNWDLVQQGTEMFGPVLVHFDRPYGHYALAFGTIGGAGDLMILGDPARGMIIVSPSWWKRHSSGASIVIDGPVRDEVRSLVVENARKRWVRLEAVRDLR